MRTATTTYTTVLYYDDPHGSLLLQGAYVEAGLSYPRVLEGLGATVGKKHRDYASALSDQAGLLKAQVGGVVLSEPCYGRGGGTFG